MALGFLLFLSSWGCGSKTPPVAPQPATPIAVQDLRAEIHADVLQLNWGLPAEGRQRPDSYAVYCWKRPAGGAPCSGCPPLYEKVGEVLVPKQVRLDSDRMTFGISLEVGYRYTCRVVSHTADVRTGAPSNEVTVNP